MHVSTGPLASHVLGFTDIDNKGLADIERYFDKELRSRQHNMALSVDIRVQHVLNTNSPSPWKNSVQSARLAW